MIDPPALSQGQRDQVEPFLLEAQQAGAVQVRLYLVTHTGARRPCLKRPLVDAVVLEVLEEIERRALSQANAMGGRHAFELEAVDDSGGVISTEVFAVTAEGFAGGGAALTEPANEGGFLAQVMRHKEVMLRTTVSAQDKTFRHLGQALEMVSTRLERSEERYAKALELLEALTLHEHERKIELVQVEAKTEALRKIGDQVAGLLPDVAAGLVGKVRGGSAKSALVARQLFESLNQTQLNGILQSLEPEQQHHVIQLMRELAASSEPAPEEH